MIIRPVQTCDYIDLTNLICEAFGNETHADFDKFEKWIMTPNQYTFVGIMDGEIVVTQTITIEHKLIHNYGLVAHSEDLAVAKKYQGKGLAQKMMDYCIEICKQKHVYKLIATCSEERVPYYGRALGTKQHEVGIRRDF